MLKIIFLALLSGGIPVAMAMAAASLIYLWLVPGSPPFVVIHRMVSGIDSFPLLAVPFLMLFVGGYYWAAFTTLWDEYQGKLAFERAQAMASEEAEA